MAEQELKSFMFALTDNDERNILILREMFGISDVETIRSMTIVAAVDCVRRVTGLAVNNVVRFEDPKVSIPLKSSQRIAWLKNDEVCQSNISYSCIVTKQFEIALQKAAEILGIPETDFNLTIRSCLDFCKCIYPFSSKSDNGFEISMPSILAGNVYKLSVTPPTGARSLPLDSLRIISYPTAPLNAKRHAPGSNRPRPLDPRLAEYFPSLAAIAEKSGKTGPKSP